MDSRMLPPKYVPAIDHVVVQDREMSEAVPLRTRLRVLHPHSGQRTKSPKITAGDLRGGSRRL